MLSAGLIGPTPALRAASAPRRAIARLRRAAVLPARLCAAAPAFAELTQASLDGLVSATAGEDTLIEALARFTGTPPGEPQRPEPSFGGVPRARPPHVPAPAGTAPNGAAPAPSRTRARPSHARVARATVPAAPPYGPADAGVRAPAGRPAVAALSVAERVLRVVGDLAPPSGGADPAAATLTRFASSVPGGRGAAATAIVPGAAGDARLALAPAPAASRDGADRRRVAGDRAPRGDDPGRRVGVAEAVVPSTPWRASRAQRVPASPDSPVPASIGDGGSRPTPVAADQALVAEVSVERRGAAPDPGLAGLAIWWEASHGDPAQLRRATARPADPPTRPETLEASDLTTAIGRLLVAEARRYGIEVDAT